ncbi:MAG TPA: biotin/lipoyl-containing protein, partial [Fimbriiglobus sp.]
MDFRLPALGEGIDAATVVGVRVKPGDAVTVGQDVIDVETDKAAVSVPAESAGTVAEVKVKPGDKVAVGGVLFTFSANGVAPPKPAAGDRKAAAPATPKPAPETPKPSETSSPSAATRQEFVLPALGEGIDAATVVGVLVKAGDAITAGQNVVAVETDKAAVEVPTDVAGTVAEVKVKPGDKIPVGAVLLVLQTSGDRKAAGPAAPKPAPEKSAEFSSQPAAVRQEQAHPANGTAKADHLVPGGPATRRLARELGVTLSEIKPTGRGGRVTLDDVKAFVRTKITEAKAGGGSAVAPGKTVADSFAHPPLPDFSKYGPVEKRPVS